MYTVVSYHLDRPLYRGLDLRADGTLITWASERDAAEYLYPRVQETPWVKGTYQRIIPVHACMSDPAWRARNEARFATLPTQYSVTDHHVYHLCPTAEEAEALAAKLSHGTGRRVYIRVEHAYDGRTQWANLKTFQHGRELR